MEVTSDAFLGRQPIFDRELRTYGYELLYRDGYDNTAFFVDPDDATRCVLESSLLEWGFEQLVGCHHGFVNAAAGVLHSGLLDLLPHRAVVELPASMPLPTETVTDIANAHVGGRRFAIDGVAHHHGGFADVEALQRVAPFVDVVKVDLLSMSVPAAWKLVAQLRTQFPKALLTAHRVQSRRHYELAEELGCDLFQGFFFAEPEVLHRTERPANMVAAMRLLAEVSRPQVDLDAVERVFGTDPTLTYGLLKLVNSSANGLSNSVASIRQAIVLLGMSQVRRLATLLTMSRGHQSVENELVVLAATRAKMAAALAGTDVDLGDRAFTAGLLSVLDVVFQQPMRDLVLELPLDDEVRNALVDGSGPVGRLLHAVIAFERADTEALERLVPDLGPSLRTAFGDGAAWAELMRRELAR